jgi:hypothetical protein
MIGLVTSCVKNCFLKHVIEGEIKEGIEVMGRRGRICEQLLDDFKEIRGYWKFKEETLYRTMWRTRIGRGCGPVLRQTADCTIYNLLT